MPASCARRATRRTPTTRWGERRARTDRQPPAIEAVIKVQRRVDAAKKAARKAIATTEA